MQVFIGQANLKNILNQNLNYNSELLRKYVPLFALNKKFYLSPNMEKTIPKFTQNELKNMHNMSSPQFTFLIYTIA